LLTFSLTLVFILELIPEINKGILDLLSHVTKGGVIISLDFVLTLFFSFGGKLLSFAFRDRGLY